MQLLTGIEACYAGGESPINDGLLVPDPEHGTRFAGLGPVMWPVGYSGRRLASGEVVVLNVDGQVTATTGKRYRFANVPQYQPGNVPAVIASLGAVPICDAYPWDLEEIPTIP